MAPIETSRRTQIFWLANFENMFLYDFADESCWSLVQSEVAGGCASAHLAAIAPVRQDHLVEKRSARRRAPLQAMILAQAGSGCHDCCVARVDRRHGCRPKRHGVGRRSCVSFPRLSGRVCRPARSNAAGEPAPTTRHCEARSGCPIRRGAGSRQNEATRTAASVHACSVDPNIARHAREPAASALHDIRSSSAQCITGRRSGAATPLPETRGCHSYPPLSGGFSRCPLSSPRAGRFLATRSQWCAARGDALRSYSAVMIREFRCQARTVGG